MSKEKFLLVSLNESKAKELAQAVTNDTCRKILDRLADDEATESQLSHSLALPISTVHYNLQLLVKAGLVISEEYHYSEKGKEVNHYKLANKYIIIAPKSTWGLKEKLKSVLPVAIIAGAVSFALRVMNVFSSSFSISASSRIVPVMTEKAVEKASEATVITDSVAGVQPMSYIPQAANTITQNVSQNMTIITNTVTERIPYSDAALWFIIGAGTAIIFYLLIDWLRNR